MTPDEKATEWLAVPINKGFIRKMARRYAPGLEDDAFQEAQIAILTAFRKNKVVDPTPERVDAFMRGVAALEVKSVGSGEALTSSEPANDGDHWEVMRRNSGRSLSLDGMCDGIAGTSGSGDGGPWLAKEDPSFDETETAMAVQEVLATLPAQQREWAQAILDGEDAPTGDWVEECRQVFEDQGITPSVMPAPPAGIFWRPRERKWAVQFRSKGKTITGASRRTMGEAKVLLAELRAKHPRLKVGRPNGRVAA